MANDHLTPEARAALEKAKGGQPSPAVERAKVVQPPAAQRPVTGWAVVDADGKIRIATVGPSRRSAIVNWLVSDRHTMVYSDATDEDIDLMWFRLRGDHEVELVHVLRGPSP